MDDWEPAEIYPKLSDKFWRRKTLLAQFFQFFKRLCLKHETFDSFGAVYDAVHRYDSLTCSSCYGPDLGVMGHTT